VSRGETEKERRRHGDRLSAPAWPISALEETAQDKILGGAAARLLKLN
jgi:hypothetical protein